MVLPKKSDAFHLAWMYRILSAIADDPFLAALLRFKGGTCAAMRGFIERFSVDLDFDLVDPKKSPEASLHLETIFKNLGLTIKEKSKRAPQYFLRYPKVGENPRNLIKIDAVFPAPKSDSCEPVRFTDIDRILYCHTIPTMFSHKLIAVVARWERTGSVASRDIFDIHTFFMKGYGYDEAIIREVRGKSAGDFLAELRDFIGEYVTQRVIDQDLNVLLRPEDFQRIRKTLKQETMMFLRPR